ncbi:hypothetical protein CFC21_025621 [Triticum aestivum]|uniref:Uncharacterized protein n=2 Tax=Triticum aestivum TaxID=4565 RepID=A0A3B6CFX5_WHEAT|nr:hypothetical protein CFC21_025621 [Triticum aestivum]
MTLREKAGQMAQIELLLGRMTLREKAGQMAQIELSVASPRALVELGVGSLLNGGGRPPFDGASASDWAGVVDGMQRLALSSRLAVPSSTASTPSTATTTSSASPSSPTTSASEPPGIPSLCGRSARRRRSRFAPPACTGPSPPASLFVGIRGGGDATRATARTQTSCAPSPPSSPVCRASHRQTTLMATRFFIRLEMGPSLVIRRENVLACAKHYVGDGGTHKGVNEGNTICSQDDLERIHMKPYPDCISQGVATIMASFSQWNGEPLHASHHLLTEVLKDKLSFQGFVVSDWEGIDHLCEPRGSDYRHCIAQAVNAGMDMVMIPFRFEKFLEDLVFLVVETGEIPLSRIDDAVERILRVKFVSGVFEHPFSDPALLDVIGCKEHRLLAREAVRKSLVLLKNGKNRKEPFLPLAKNAKRILIAGTHADNIGYQCGGWTISWHGDSGKITPGTNILEAIQQSVEVETEVVYDECPIDATIEAGKFSYAVVVVGEVPYAESLGDRTDLSIPFNGSDLITRVASKVPTLVIVISGRPLVIEPQVLEKVDALVATWLPGSEGMGVADCLFGDHDFVGTLPVTWFRYDEQPPINIGGANYDPLFPFGYGLKCSKAIEI